MHPPTWASRGTPQAASATAAFIIGWDLALELTVGATAVTIGWSGYLNQTLDQIFGVTLPTAITAPPGADGVVNGASFVFFASIGFDIVATTAEETNDPQRDMPRGIIGSLVVVTVLYIAVPAVITGMVAYDQLGGEAPIADAFAGFGLDWIKALVFAGALVALTKTVLVDLLGRSRVTFAMGRDGLLPSALGRSHPTYGTPSPLILLTGAVVAVLSAFLPCRDVTEMVNIGTLFASTMVAAGVLPCGGSSRTARARSASPPSGWSRRSPSS